MEPPHGQRPPQGESAPSQARPTTRRARHQPDRPAPLPAWQQADGPRTMPHWKRGVLRHVLPVCVALAWQLGVVIGLLGVFVVGLLLLRLL
jgi:antibiotic biosynthesis monooxygenase (ABM) superfamily enzyme